VKKVPEGKIGAKESRTSGIRRYTGLIGGALVKLSEKLRLPADTYYRIHNATLPTPDGTAEIDDVFVSRYGIFVVETNNMKGWIFGEKNQSQWTQQIFKESLDQLGGRSVRGGVSRTGAGVECPLWAAAL